MCLPSGEYATERTSPSAPSACTPVHGPTPARQHQRTQQPNNTPSQNTVRTSLPVAAFQTLTVLSQDPLTMCLPSGEYATEHTVSECPVSVHSCSWPNPARQHQCTQQQMIHQCQNTNTHLLARLRIPDLHGLVKRPADDVLAVRRVRHRVHPVRVPRQRALLLMDQTRRSAQSTQQQTIGR